MQIVLENASATLREPGREFRISVDDGLSLSAGEAYAVTGKSGTGKTLFLELLGLLVRPDPGGVYRLAHPDGSLEDLATLWDGARTALSDCRARVFGFVLQTGGLFPFLSVRENVALSQEVTGRTDNARVSDLIDLLELGDISDYKPDQLSVGQRQRTAVARALAHRPAFVIADEPTSALDPELSETVIELLFEASREDGAGVVISTHDAGFTRTFPVTQLSVALDPAAGDIERTTSRVTRMAA
ncbi:MAG: ATP-binding cassette domain-containing protein [Rhodobacteraceae bacterium]|nr:ATP-binding cassette domain-containing protein [Paracoccaceae bacterium]MCY4138746.1 ATP-binding cassette domain-containing protein [Paracoccaceae bacterium]